jgi:hypothetical protein
MQINIHFSGGSASRLNFTKRWNVYKNQTHIGSFKYHIQDRKISYLPEANVLLEYSELIEVLRVMAQLYTQETKISIN